MAIKDIETTSVIDLYPKEVLKKQLYSIKLKHYRP